MASVSKRTWTNNGDAKHAWIVRYTDHGGNRRIKTFEMKKEADRYRLKVETELERGEHVPDAETTTVAAASADFILECERRARIGDHMTNSTVAMYGTCAKRLVASIGARRVSEVTPEIMQRVANELAERLSPVSVKHTMGFAKLLFDHARAKRWILRNPVTDRRLSLPGRTRSTPIPSREELLALLEASHTRMFRERTHGWLVRRGIIHLAIFGGLRRGELCGLKWEHVDFARGIIRVRHSLSRLDGLKSPKSKAGVREVPLVTPAREALEALVPIGGAKKGEFVFTSATGSPIAPNDMTNLQWQAIAKRAGLVDAKGRARYRFHSLRHAAASLMISQGLSPLHVRTFIGHASVRTTLDIYGHMFPEDESIRTAANAIATTLGTQHTRNIAPQVIDFIDVD